MPRFATERKTLSDQSVEQSDIQKDEIANCGIEKDFTRHLIRCITVAMSIAQATHTIPEKPAERRVWIGYQLRMRRTSLRQIARRLEVSHQAVSNALDSPSYRIEVELARVLEVPVTVLFPERFDETGARIPCIRPDHLSAGRGGGDSQNECHTLTPTGRAA